MADLRGAFFAQEIYNAPLNVPGVSPSPAGSLGALQSEGIVPNSSFTVGNGLSTGASNAPLSPDPPYEYGVPDAEANGTIDYSYIVFPWADGSEEKIREGMLVFVARHQDKKLKNVHMASISKLNTLIREQTAYFEEGAGNTPAMQEPSFVDLKRLLEQYGESKLERYHSSIRRNMHNPERVQAMINEFGAEHEDLKTLYKLSKQNVARYMTKTGILNMWNYSGVVKSVSHGTTLQNIDLYSTTAHVLTVGVTVGKEAHVPCLWDMSHNGTRCFLILKRIGNRHGSYRPYQFVPYATRDGSLPPLSETRYRDYDGQLCDGVVINIGVINNPGMQYGESNSETRMAAAGIHTTLEDAYAATGVLKNVTLELGI